MADEDEIAALVIDNGSGMCKGGYNPGEGRARLAKMKSGGCRPQVGPTAPNRPPSAPAGGHTGIRVPSTRPGHRGGNLTQYEYSTLSNGV